MRWIGKGVRSLTKKRAAILILVFAAVVGICLLLYPTVNGLYGDRSRAQIIVRYSNEVEQTEESAREAMLTQAEEYNKKVADRCPHWVLSEEETQEYESMLSPDSTGVMGYVNIPKIDCTLPIYHGANEATLRAGAGHIEGSSLPVGGESTHSAISAHRGLAGNKFFTDLDLLAYGDVFYINIMGRTLAYEVDQIVTVEPYELEELEIVEGEDLCTLVTCTPYGQNTQRLFVRGRRIELADTPDSPDIAPTASNNSGNKITVVFVFIAAILLIAIILAIAVIIKKKTTCKHSKIMIKTAKCTLNRGL